MITINMSNYEYIYMFGKFITYKSFYLICQYMAVYHNMKTAAISLIFHYEKDAVACS